MQCHAHADKKGNPEHSFLSWVLATLPLAIAIAFGCAPPGTSPPKTTVTMSGCPSGQDVPIGAVTLTFLAAASNGDVGSVNDVQVSASNPPNVTVLPREIRLDRDNPSGMVVITPLDVGKVSVEFIVIVFGPDDEVIESQTCTFTAVAPEPEAAAAALLKRFEAETLAKFVSEITGVPVPNSANENQVTPTVPQAAQEIKQTGTARKQLDGATVTQTLGNTDFPCGAGDFGLTVCPDPNVALAPEAGEWLFVFSTFDAAIPLSDTSRFYQYAFVFDQNANVVDNFAPLPEFPNDYFQNTDRWYSAEYSPQDGWRLVVTDAPLSNPTVISSAARIIISDNVMMLAVPASEFTDPNPPYRATAFCHDGGFGLDGGFWSGDLEPKVTEPLYAFD